MKTIQQALQQTRSRLPLAQARIDCEVLLAHVLHKSRTFLYTYPEETLTPTQWEQFQNLISARSEGMPVAYLTGSREFWSYAFHVTQATLIPRPETELLIELALKHLDAELPLRVLDLGTGSGAIAITLAKERPAWRITATDYSPAALEVAAGNAQRLNTCVSFIESDWFSALPNLPLFDAILSNPPYIADKDPHLEQGDLRFEPSLALRGGEDGLEAYRIIIKQSLARLTPNGLLLLEHGHDQSREILSLLQKHGYQHVQCWSDWQGHGRISGGFLKAVDVDRVF